MFYRLKELIVGSALSVLLPVVSIAADLNDNYSTAVTERWVNDSSDQAVQLLNIMTCMAGQGGVGRAGYANKSWIAFVDEVKCGIDPGDTSGGDKKAKIQYKY